MIRAKVTSATLAASISVYVFQVLSADLGVRLDATIQALVIAALTAAVTFAAGYLKKEHVITEQEYDSFANAPEAAPVAPAVSATPEVAPVYEDTLEPPAAA